MSSYQWGNHRYDVTLKKNEANNSLKVRGECAKHEGWQIQQKTRNYKVQKIERKLCTLKIQFITIH